MAQNIQLFKTMKGQKNADRELQRERIAQQEKEMVHKERDMEVELAKIAAEEAKIAAERDVEMVRIDSIAEQAEKDKDLKRTVLSWKAIRKRNW